MRIISYITNLKIMVSLKLQNHVEVISNSKIQNAIVLENPNYLCVFFKINLSIHKGFLKIETTVFKLRGKKERYNICIALYVKVTFL